MSKYKSFADEIRAAEPGISNAELGVKVKARIAKEDPAPTPYDIHGRPDPMDTDLEVTGAIRDKVALIIGKNKAGLMIQYIRKTKPTVGKVIVDVRAGAVYNKLLRGEPIGVLVAFKDGDKLLIGWSKYNLKKDKDTGVQIEQLVFTKKDAIETAVLRALTDSINGAVVPFKIAEQLPAFLERIEKYFGKKADNTANTVGFA